MDHETILYLSEGAGSTESELAALKATGYEVVSTNSSTQAMALLFIMHSVAAVMLAQRAREQANCNLAQSLRSIRPDVRIVLLCRDRIDRVPSCVDACVSSGQPLEQFAFAVRRLLTANPVF